MKHPNILLANTIVENPVKVLIGGRWIPARPMAYSSVFSRIKAAWLVFTGKADALLWERQ